MLELALGVLEWRPREFWESTPIELDAALAGRIRASVPPGPRAPRQEIGDNGVPLPPGMTRADALELARLNDEVAAEVEGA